MTTVLAIVLVGIAVGLWVTQKMGSAGSSPKCKHCGANELVEVKRETVGTQTVEQHGGGMGGGGDIRLQTEDEVTYRCSACQQTSTFIVRRTN